MGFTAKETTEERPQPVKEGSQEAETKETSSQRPESNGLSGTELQSAAENKMRDEVLQSLIPQSGKHCSTVLDHLNKLSGKPLLLSIAPELDPDLRKYHLKQPNEDEGAFYGGGPHAKTDPGSMDLGAMRPGVYGQRTERAEDRKPEDAESLKERPAYFETAKEIFAGSAYFDLVRNHNAVLSHPKDRGLGQLLKRIGEQTKQEIGIVSKSLAGKDAANAVLINFDAHSDVFTSPVTKGGESIAQWVNGMLRENPNIKEFIWVLPDNFKSDPHLRQHYFEHKGYVPRDDSVLVHDPPEGVLYLSKETGALIANDKPHDYSESKYRAIPYKKVTIDELPNLKNRNVVASIDLDYFDNRGYDTSYSGSTEWKADAGFAKFLDALKSKDIKPIVTTVSASPEYVRKEHMRDLLRFATHVSEASNGKMDEVVVPKQHGVYFDTPHQGAQVDRNTPSLKVLFDMFKIDAETKAPTDSIDLGKAGEKRERAIEAVRKQFKVEQDKALQILDKLDAADGNKNGVIEFERIESLLLRVCKKTDQEMLIKDPMVRGKSKKK